MEVSGPIQPDISSNVPQSGAAGQADASPMALSEVQRKAARGPAFMLGRRAVALLVSGATLVIMPRLLGPEAYGLAAMSALVFSLADMFKDFGLTSALLRKGTIRQEEVNFLFWVNVAMTSVLSLMIAAVSPFVGIFFSQPILTWVVLVSLIGFSVGGVSLQHRAVMNRDLRFAELALIDSISLLVQFFVTLVMAILFRNVWAIVLGNTIGAIVNSVAYIVQSNWRPSKPRMINDARSIFAFGANTSIYTLSVFVSTNVISLLVGKIYGVNELGQYNQANTVLSVPLKNGVEPLAQATLPVLARLRPYLSEYRKCYLRLVEGLTLIVLPFSVLLFFVGQAIVATVLGSGWSEAGTLLELLAPVVSILGVGAAVSDLFVTQNRARDLRVVGLVEMVGRVAMTSIGIAFSIYAAVLAHVLATFLAVSFRVWMISRHGGLVSVRDHWAAILPAAPVAACLALGCMLGALGHGWFGIASVWKPVLVCAFGIGSALAAVALVPLSRQAAKQFADFAAGRSSSGPQV